jgi:hypothetical protein
MAMNEWFVGLFWSKYLQTQVSFRMKRFMFSAGLAGRLQTVRALSRFTGGLTQYCSGINKQIVETRKRGCGSGGGTWANSGRCRRGFCVRTRWKGRVDAYQRRAKIWTFRIASASRASKAPVGLLYHTPQLTAQDPQDPLLSNFRRLAPTGRCTGRWDASCGWGVARLLKDTPMLWDSNISPAVRL